MIMALFLQIQQLNVYKKKINLVKIFFIIFFFYDTLPSLTVWIDSCLMVINTINSQLSFFKISPKMGLKQIFKIKKNFRVELLMNFFWWDYGISRIKFLRNFFYIIKETKTKSEENKIYFYYYRYILYYR